MPEEAWTGVTTFTVGPEQTLVPDNGYQTEDFWMKDGHTWIRVHVLPRSELFMPFGTVHGPTNPDKLKDTRRTTCYHDTGQEIRLEDNWKINGSRSLAAQWTGTTEFEEDVELGLELPTLLGKTAKGLSLPTEPTSQERELHNLTHVPYQPWCTICVRAK